MQCIIKHSFIFCSCASQWCLLELMVLTGNLETQDRYTMMAELKFHLKVEKLVRDDIPVFPGELAWSNTVSMKLCSASLTYAHMQPLVIWHLAEPGCLCTNQSLENRPFLTATPGPLLLHEKRLWICTPANARVPTQSQLGGLVGGRWKTRSKGCLSGLKWGDLRPPSQDTTTTPQSHHMCTSCPSAND